MELKEVVDIIVNNGVALAVLGYFIFRDYKYITQLTQAIAVLQTTITAVKDTLDTYINKGDE